MTLRFSPNLSLLWADLPLPERFARAAATGFGAVELWWPGEDEAARLPELTQRWGLHLALLNFDAGNMPAGDGVWPLTWTASPSCGPTYRSPCGSRRTPAAPG